MSIFCFEKKEPKECMFRSSKIWEGQRIIESLLGWKKIELKDHLVNRTGHAL